MIQFIFLFCIHLLLPSTNSLKISFSRSKTLTNLALYDKNVYFPQVILLLFRSEEFWPVLVEFNQARYFDFESILISFMTYHISCAELLNIISHPNFPSKHLITGKVLMTCNGCFAKLTPQALKRAQNPLDFIEFNPSKWSYDQNLIFLQSSDPPLQHKWTNVCLDLDVFERSMETEDDTTTDLIIESISADCFKKLTISSTLKLLDRLEIDFLCYNLIIESNRPRSNAFSWSLSLISLLTSSAQDTDAEENHLIRFFSLKIFKRTITIVALLIKNHYSSKIQEIGRKILVNHIERLYQNHGILYRKKLIILMQNYLYKSNIDPKSESILSEMIHFSSSGTWLLNLVTISKHFDVIKDFVPQFLKYFFDSTKTILTTSDVATLLKLVPGENQVIFNLLMRKRPELIEPFFKDYCKSIPRVIKTDFIPLDTVLSFVYKVNRRIEFNVVRIIEIPSNSNWISIIDSICKFLAAWDYKCKTLQLNIRVFHGKKIFNLAYLLNLFFKSILDSIQLENGVFSSSFWWIVTGRSFDNRPTIIPSLNLPPQVMEVIGHILAASLNANVKIPLLIDWDYFSFSADFPHFAYDSNILIKFYPNYKQEYIDNSQISRILNLEKIIRLKSVIYLSSPGTFRLLGSHEKEHSTDQNREIDLLKLIIVTTKALRFYLNEAFNFESIKLEIIYKLIFK